MYAQLTVLPSHYSLTANKYHICDTTWPAQHYVFMRNETIKMCLSNTDTLHSGHINDSSDFCGL
jgi:hypothetical protein